MSYSSVQKFIDDAIDILKNDKTIREILDWQDHYLDFRKTPKPDGVTPTNWKKYKKEFVNALEAAGKNERRKFKVTIDPSRETAYITTKLRNQSGNIKQFIRSATKDVKLIGASKSFEHVAPTAKAAGLSMFSLELLFVGSLRTPTVANLQVFINQVKASARDYSKDNKFCIVKFDSRDLVENIKDSPRGKQGAALVYKQIEADLKRMINNGIITLSGSDSISTVSTKMAANVLEDNFKKLKSKSVRTNFKNNKINRPKVKKITSFEITKKNKAKSFRSTVTGQFISGAQAQRQQVGFSQSPLQLIKALNNQLPKRVAANMGTPKLNFRTGRFASSTHITDIQQTRTGMMSIGYSYQLNPYDVFEMGRGKDPWKTPERDPRKIIDESIRELMVQYTTERFTTRRTT